MAHEIVDDGVDEPARNGDDYADLLSVLDSHHLALAMDIVEASEADVFVFDENADPEELLTVQIATGDSFDTPGYDGVATDGERIAAHRVPEGIVNLEGVTAGIGDSGAETPVLTVRAVDASFGILICTPNM